jgi:hypothetical protein
MTQEDIIRMALEAKLPVNHPDWADAARRFAALVRADEREACANVCDDKYAEYPEIDPDYAFALAASDLAKTIRARGRTHD